MIGLESWDFRISTVPKEGLKKSLPLFITRASLPWLHKHRRCERTAIEEHLSFEIPVRLKAFWRGTDIKANNLMSYRSQQEPSWNMRQVLQFK